MYKAIMQALQKHDCLLAVVGQVHLGVLAQRFDTEGINVEALLFAPLVVDESKS